MVARGDLGMEIPVEKVRGIQPDIVYPMSPSHHIPVSTISLHHIPVKLICDPFHRHPLIWHGIQVPLAQKMMITKANISGKFIITATQVCPTLHPDMLRIPLQ